MVLILVELGIILYFLIDGHPGADPMEYLRLLTFLLSVGMDHWSRSGAKLYHIRLEHLFVGEGEDRNLSQPTW